MNELSKSEQSNTPISPAERIELKKWVDDGNDPLSNPWYWSDENGLEMPFVEALRIELEFCEDMRERMKP